MRVEHLHICMEAATREKDLDMGNLYRVVDLVQMTFRDGILQTEYNCQMLFILTKGNGNFRVIGIL